MHLAAQGPEQYSPACPAQSRLPLQEFAARTPVSGSVRTHPQPGLALPVGTTRQGFGGIQGPSHSRRSVRARREAAGLGAMTGAAAVGARTSRAVEEPMTHSRRTESEVHRGGEPAWQVLGGTGLARRGLARRPAPGKAEGWLARYDAGRGPGIQDGRPLRSVAKGRHVARPGIFLSGFWGCPASESGLGWPLNQPHLVCVTPALPVG